MTPFPEEPARARGPMRFVMSTYPSTDAARIAVAAALERRLAACANVLAIDSRYWWRGQVETANESLVLFKTVPKRVGALLAFLETTHPYETPEVVELDVPRASAGYLRYLAAELGAGGPPANRRARARRPEGRRARGARGPGRTRAPHRRRSRRTGS